VERAAASLPSSVSWELRGWVDNPAVRAFYSAHAVSAFLSLSVSEGIPVSMMEAQSFGVPIVALAVGGIPELVTSRTGSLLPDGASPIAVAAVLRDVLDRGQFAPAQIRRAFAERYEARQAYGTFADSLLSIWSSRTARVRG
jgi:glycosyltransferase involved in cell wall biosynthesis